MVVFLQIRTHSIRKAHENIDRTLKAAEVILAKFDLSRQVGPFPRFRFSSLVHFPAFFVRSTKN